jgi:cell division protein YceG involved in septum cleavage
MIEKERFRLYDEPNKKKYSIISLRMNEKEQADLKKDMKALQQAKESTAIKQMLEIARFVIHRSEMGKIARVLYNNIRRNVRIGINEVEDDYLTNVKQN